jgi:hypothetical protein
MYLYKNPEPGTLNPEQLYWPPMNADERRFTYTKTIPPSDFCLLTWGSAADKRR